MGLCGQEATSLDQTKGVRVLCLIGTHTAALFPDHLLMSCSPFFTTPPPPPCESNTKVPKFDGNNTCRCSHKRGTLYRAK